MAFNACRVPVDIDGRAYDILIGRALISQSDSFDDLGLGGDALVVTNRNVGSHYLGPLVQAIKPIFRRVLSVELPDGEEFKSWQTMQRVFDSLLQSACDRRTTLIALGGGVIGDMTGFAAACYMRGVPYIQVPTTLLAQVDSSVGGKTAINHPLGKNMIGAFYQPRRVVIDLDTLDTLPQREVIAGLAEVVKYGPIADETFFEWLENHIDALLGRDKEALLHAVATSCRIKASVVAADERESGRRAILNFGHTFAHAIETGLGYGAWLHGEAVGCGMVLAAALSARLDLIERDDAERLTRLVAKAGLPVKPPEIPTAQFIDLMRVDKKAQGGEVRFVVLDRIGSASLRPVSLDLVADVIDRQRAH